MFAIFGDTVKVSDFGSIQFIGANEYKGKSKPDVKSPKKREDSNNHYVA
jgi:hypothetical protein